MPDISEGQLSLMPERPDEGGPALHGAQAVASAGFQIVEVNGAAVGKFVMFQMTPEVFGWVEFGCVGGGSLDFLANSPGNCLVFSPSSRSFPYLSY